MTEKRELTCIGCPMGCLLTISIENKIILDISGYTCKKGKHYAEEEVTAPTRMVTSTIKVVNGNHPVVSVKTKDAIPKNLIFNCMKLLEKIEVIAPIHIGDIIIENTLETKIPIIATKNIPCTN